jgi:formylmethanofuran dehydrogenase subunit E
MSILGYRLGSAARDALEPCLGPKARLKAVFYHQTCALDGIQYATGCTLGNGNIEVAPEGQHRLVLATAGAAVEAALTSAALERGRAYAALRDRLSALPEGGPEAVALGQEMEAILLGLEVAPAAVLVVTAHAESGKSA